jgi:hypothetical protein
VPGPFAQALAEDQRVVAKPQQVIETRREMRLDARRIECAVRAQLRGHGLVFRPDRRQ